MDKCVTELLFPDHVIPTLIDTRGENWQSLVKELSSLESNTIEIMAFTLTMARIGNCVFCNSSSFRAIQGCRQCARQALSRFRGSDEDLLDLYHSAKIEVSEYLEKMRNHE